MLRINARMENPDLITYLAALLHSICVTLISKVLSVVTVVSKVNFRVEAAVADVPISI